MCSATEEVGQRADLCNYHHLSITFLFFKYQIPRNTRDKARCINTLFPLNLIPSLHQPVCPTVENPTLHILYYSQDQTVFDMTDLVTQLFTVNMTLVVDMVLNNQYNFVVFIHLNILFCQCRSTGLPAIETIPFQFVHDDVGVACAVLCAAHPILKQYKWGAVHVVQCTAQALDRNTGQRLLHQSLCSRADLMHSVH